MDQLSENLDFSNETEQEHTISSQPVHQAIPQPLVDWITSILARIRATENTTQTGEVNE